LVNCAALIRTVIIEVLSMVALAFAIQVMLEATVSIATEIRALVMELYLPTPKIVPCAPVIRVGKAPIAPSKLRCHAIEVRMGMIIRYAADTALPIQVVHAIQMEIIRVARAIVWPHLRALTVSIATEIRALVMELYLSTPKIITGAPVIRVTRGVIARKPWRARMDQMTNRAEMEEHLQVI
jgi:hypothetical protein